MFRDDYLMRMIEQLASAIARIAGLNRSEQHDEALAAADAAWGELLGDIPPELAGAVDSRTLAGMLRRPDKIRLAAEILREQARALAGLGDPLGAARRSRRALELLLEASALATGELGGAGAEAAAAAIRELAARVPHDALAARYQAMLPADG